MLHNLKDTLKVPASSTGLQRPDLCCHYENVLQLQTLQHQSKGVADYESMQAVQYLSVQVHRKWGIPGFKFLLRCKANRECLAACS